MNIYQVANEALPGWTEMEIIKNDGGQLIINLTRRIS